MGLNPMNQELWVHNIFTVKSNIIPVEFNTTTEVKAMNYSK